MDKLKSIQDLRNLRENLRKNHDKERNSVVVCGGTGCETFGGHDIYDTFKDIIEEKGLENKFSLKKTGCQGFCERGPLVSIQPANIFYQKVKTSDVQKIVEETLINNQIVDKLLYTDTQTRQKITNRTEIPFYKKTTSACTAL